MRAVADLRIKSCILVVCSPCLVRVLKNILKKNNLEAIVIDYFCSGQTTLEGTYCYYRFLEIDKNNVANIRYRGNGWPNGIEITLKSGEIIKKENYTEPWETIHRSQLFRPRRCFFCKQVESEYADISVGDPWLKEYIQSDSIGNSLFLVHTLNGQNIIDGLVKAGKIDVNSVGYDLFEKSQRPSVCKKNRIAIDKDYYEFIVKLLQKKWYFLWAQKNIINMKIHIWIMIHVVHRFYNIKNMKTKSIFRKIVAKLKSGGDCLKTHSGQNVS